MFTGIGDLERLVSKISANKANPRDYISLKNSLIIASKLKELDWSDNKGELQQKINSLNIPVDLINELSNAILDEPSVTVGIGRDV